MLMLVLGLVVFLGIHLLPTSPVTRNSFASRLGDNGYKAAFSVVSLIGFAMIVAGYHKVQLATGKNPQLWSPPTWGRHATMLLMLPVFVLLFATYARGHIAAIVRHPMITAVKLWALAHLLVRGDLASLLLFGGFLAWAVYDRISLKHRPVATSAPAASPSIAMDAVAVVGGLVAYAVFLKWGHRLLIGIPLIP